MTDIARLGIAVDTAPVDSAATSLKNFKKVTNDVARQSVRNTTAISTGIKKVAVSANSTAAPLQKMATNTAKATKAGGGFAHQARMMSMQLSQVAQQGSVTGNYFQALAIQLPDLMLGFGTLGILIGAVAGSLAVPLVNAITGSSRELKKFNEEIDETISGLKSVRLENTIGSIDALTDRIKKNNDEIERLNDTPDKMGGRALSNARRLKIQAERQAEVNELQKEQVKNQQALLVFEKRRADISKEDDDTSEAAAIERAIDAQEQLNTLKGQFDPVLAAGSAFGKRNEVIELSNKELGLSESEYEGLRRQNAQKLSDDLLAIEKRTQDQKNMMLTDSQQTALQQSGQLFGNLAAIAKEGGKKQFDEYKALASAQAAISASLAVAGVLGQSGTLGPFAIPLAVSIGALAAVQIAQIQGQEYQSSRASGGQAKGRVLVGENGPEVLNLGSQTGYVSPNTSVGSAGAQVTNVFQIGTDVTETTRAEVMRLAPALEQRMLATLQTEARRGGNTSRALGRR